MPGPGGGRKVLLVDDEPKITETLGLIFTSQGYDVRWAGSSEEAIELIAEWQPDMAILDVMLPGMNGIDLAIVLKANYPGCHLLLFSAQPGTTDLAAQAAKQGHFFEILAKPVQPAYILDRVADMLALGQDELPEHSVPPKQMN
jgi:CheY-like chemotaxis protein